MPGVVNSLPFAFDCLSKSLAVTCRTRQDDLLNLRPFVWVSNSGMWLSIPETRTDHVISPISEVCNGTVSLIKEQKYVRRKEKNMMYKKNYVLQKALDNNKLCAAKNL